MVIVTEEHNIMLYSRHQVLLISVLNFVSMINHCIYTDTANNYPMY